MKIITQNNLYREYRHRFKVEFWQLLEQQTFAEVIFRNSELLLKDKGTAYYHSLLHCFGCSFEGMALGLTRIWDEKRGDINLISIPNLVSVFEDYNFLGCHGLASGGQDREAFDNLYADPLRMRFRVFRTEALAHAVKVGASNDRKKSDIKDPQEFDIVNGEALEYCHQTLELLFSLNDQLNKSGWRAKKSVNEMKLEWSEHHVAFLKHFENEVE